MRTILDKFGAEWEREDLGVVSTMMDVPELRDVNLPPELTGRIRDVARQVLEALG